LRFNFFAKEPELIAAVGVVLGSDFRLLGSSFELSF